MAAVDFGGTKTAVVLADGPGHILARYRFDTTTGAASVAAAIDVVRDMRGSGSLAGLGVVSPGIVGDDGIRLAPHVAGWEKLRLPALFGAAFPRVAMAFGNDVKAAALAEATTGRLRAVDPGMLVNLGTGVAVAIVVAGRVVRGAHGWAGEVGYSPGVGADGERAPVEQLVGGAALQRLAIAEGLPTTAALIDAGLADAALGCRIADSFAAFADGLISWCLVVDPERIVFTGGLLAASELWWKPVARRLASVLPDPPQLARSAFDADAALHGALLLGRRASRAGVSTASAAGGPSTDVSRSLSLSAD
ncbi:MAG: ROK family protein [Nakamurella sp.]